MEVMHLQGICRPPRQDQLTRQWLALRKRGASPRRASVIWHAAIRSCLTIKVLFKFPLRPTVGMVARSPKMVNLDWAVPDDTALCRRQKTAAVQMPF
jgi:hypothetical protein